MPTVAMEQEAQFMPPRKGEIIALTVDTSPRAYDLWSLSWEGIQPQAGGKRRMELFIQFQAETDDVFMHLSAANATQITSGALAAGQPLAYASNYAARILKGIVYKPMRLDLSLDRYLHVVAATGGVLRFWAVSSATG